MTAQQPRFTISVFTWCNPHRVKQALKSWSVEGLAEAIGVPPGALARTLRAFQEAGTNNEGPGGMAMPPFYALGPVQSWIVFSEGGLNVDDKLRVLHRDGGPIPGLYAAGSAGQGGGVFHSAPKSCFHPGMENIFKWKRLQNE